MDGQLCILGSMATRGLLAEFAAAWDGEAAVRSVGGIEAARLVRDGDPVDVVVLSAAAMGKLEVDGFIVPGSVVAIAISSMVAAVRTGEALPDMAGAEGVERAVLAARRTGYSTGPSGDHLLRLLDAWGIRETLGDRLVQAPPGVPVGRLLTEGTVDLGFQQRSELMNLEGVTIAGHLPQPIAADTVFSAGIARASIRADAARGFIASLGAAETGSVKRRYGLQPA